MYRRRAQADGNSIAGLFQGLLWGTAALLVGALVGGYFIGAAIGIVGTAAAVGAGFGIILGGAAVLTGIGFGIFGIVNCCLNKRDESKRKQAENLLLQHADKKVEAPAVSTKQILRGTSASNLINSAAIDVNESETSSEEESRTNSSSAPVKQSSFTRLAAILKRNSQPELSSTEVKGEPKSLKL